MNLRGVRSGFALITAVIIAAAILTTIVGITALTLRETRVQAEQSASDQALAMAERGLADAVSLLRADKVVAKAVIDLGDGATWELPPASGANGTVSSTGHAFYWIRVVTQGSAQTDRNYVMYAAGFIVRPDVSAYSTAQLKTLAASTTDVLARRIVQVSSHGTLDTSTTSHNIPGTSNGRSAFDYGLFTGDTFSMVGSKNLANVTTDGTSGMYAKEDINMTSNHTLTNLQLYAEHAINASGVTVTPGTLASISHANYNPIPPINFPQLNLEGYMDLFDAFVAGATPFNGVPVYDGNGVQTNLGYPDLSNSTVRSAVLAALGNPQNNTVTVDGQVHHFATPDSLSNYTDLVVNGTLPGLSSDPVVLSQQRSALKSTLSKSVFYVRTSAGDPNVRWQSDRAYLAGVIVVSGTATFTGCPDFADGQVAAVLAKGDVSIEGGTKDDPSKGVFYSEGGVKYSGGGSFEGQIISQDSVQFKGSGNVTFKNYSSILGDLLPGGEATTTYTTEILGFKAFSQKASGWTEKAWSDFPAS